VHHVGILYGQWWLKYYLRFWYCFQNCRHTSMRKGISKLFRTVVYSTRCTVHSTQYTVHTLHGGDNLIS